MHKDDNKLALSVLATLISGIALIYTLIMFHNIIFAVAGMSILFIITAYILTQNLIAFSNMRNKSLNVQLKNCIDDISNQLEAMNGAQSQLGKATYLYTRQAAQAVATLENNYTESQEALYKNLASLSNAQNKATKLMIKYDQNNTTKLIATIKDMRNHLSETMIQGFDQIQPNNDEIVSVLEDIVAYLKSQPNNIDQTLGLQLNNVAHELQNISNSIQRVQVPTQTVMQAAPNAIAEPIPESPVEISSEAATEMTETIAEAVPEMTEPIPEAAAEMTETIPEATTDMTETIPETIAEPITDTTTDSIDESTITTIDETTTESVADVVSEPTMEDIPEADTETIAEAPSVAPIADKGANDMLSADEIAALFAAAEPAPKKEEEKPFTPTFTVVGKSKQEEELPEDSELAPETSSIPTVGDLDDPNKQLSPDEIAALFAAAEPAPKKAEHPAPEPVKVEPLSDDPNKQLSPDEIAALFAAAEPAPKREEDEEQRMDEALAKSSEETAQAEPKIEPISDDPNKQLSPDEIAALFAQMG